MESAVSAAVSRDMESAVSAAVSTYVGRDKGNHLKEINTGNDFL